MRIKFKDFLLNEGKYYLSQRIGDILTAVQDLQQNSGGMGARQLVANAERIVDQIRAILHSNWSKKEEKHLTSIQKIGVAIARAIDEKDDLEEILPTVVQELQAVSEKMGNPVQQLATPQEEEPAEKDNATLEPSAGKTVDKSPLPNPDQSAKN